MYMVKLVAKDKGMGMGMDVAKETDEASEELIKIMWAVPRGEGGEGEERAGWVARKFLYITTLTFCLFVFVFC